MEHVGDTLHHVLNSRLPKTAVARQAVEAATELP